MSVQRINNNYKNKYRIKKGSLNIMTKSGFNSSIKSKLTWRRKLRKKLNTAKESTMKRKSRFNSRTPLSHSKINVLNSKFNKCRTDCYKIKRKWKLRLKLGLILLTKLVSLRKILGVLSVCFTRTSQPI